MLGIVVTIVAGTVLMHCMHDGYPGFLNRSIPGMRAHNRKIRQSLLLKPRRLIKKPFQRPTSGLRISRLLELRGPRQRAGSPKLQ